MGETPSRPPVGSCTIDAASVGRIRCVAATRGTGWQFYSQEKQRKRPFLKRLFRRNELAPLLRDLQVRVDPAISDDVMESLKQGVEKESHYASNTRDVETIVVGTEEQRWGNDNRRDDLIQDVGGAEEVEGVEKGSKGFYS